MARTTAAKKTARSRKVIDLREKRTRTRKLTGYDETFLLCRDIRHAWSVEGYYEDSVWIRRRLVCVRCGTTRKDTWTPWGVRLRSQYNHPDGYRLDRDVKAEDIRAEELRRIDVFKSEDDLVQSLVT